MITFQHNPDPIKLSELCLNELLKIIKNHLQNHQTCNIALPGGSSPIHLFQQWAQIANFPWNKLNIYLSDERIVPPNDDNANQKLIREHILNKISSSTNFIPFNTAYPIQKIASLLKLPPHLDIALLGIGPDAHTASLFPSDPSYLTNNTQNISTTCAPFKPYPRISLSLSYLQKTTHIFFLAIGSNKADALKKIEHDTSRKSPLLPPTLVAQNTNALCFHDINFNQ